MAKLANLKHIVKLDHTETTTASTPFWFSSLDSESMGNSRYKCYLVTVPVCWVPCANLEAHGMC